MISIEVQRLKLSCKVEKRERARFAIEDGLRTSLPDESRFVLIRAMQIKGELASGPARRDEALREGWLRAITGARHGSDDGAPNANCVWFASREEAETLLLARLLAGRSVDAWYWKLAVPDWRGRPLRSWFPECLAVALQERLPQRLAKIAETCILAGATELLLEALGTTKIPNAHFPWAAPGIASTNRSEREIASADITARHVAKLLVSTIPRQLREPIVSLSSNGPKAQFVCFKIVEALLLRASPATALSPPLLHSVVERAIEMLLSPDMEPPRPSRTGERHAPSSGDRRSSPVAIGPKPSAPRDRNPSKAPKVAGTSDSERKATDQTQSAQASFDPIAPARWDCLNSAHAGLWLVVPSLMDLGFREWILERPDVLAENPGRLIIEGVAAHYHIGMDDPALAPFEGRHSPTSGNDWVAMWRCGLDRWLRRVAKRRLHDLLGREGLLEVCDRQLLVRFPAATADLRLRRRALDRDPGWTDWLGLSIRYCFGVVEERP